MCYADSEESPHAAAAHLARAANASEFMERVCGGGAANREEWWRAARVILGHPALLASEGSRTASRAANPQTSLRAQHTELLVFKVRIRAVCGCE